MLTPVSVLGGIFWTNCSFCTNQPHIEHSAVIKSRCIQRKVISVITDLGRVPGFSLYHKISLQFLMSVWMVVHSTKLLVWGWVGGGLVFLLTAILWRGLFVSFSCLWDSVLLLAYRITLFAWDPFLWNAWTEITISHSFYQFHQVSIMPTIVCLGAHDGGHMGAWWSAPCAIHMQHT